MHRPSLNKAIYSSLCQREAGRDFGGSSFNTSNGGNFYFCNLFTVSLSDFSCPTGSHPRSRKVFSRTPRKQFTNRLETIDLQKDRPTYNLYTDSRGQRGRSQGRRRGFSIRPGTGDQDQSQRISCRPMALEGEKHLEKGRRTPT